MNATEQEVRESLAKYRKSIGLSPELPTEVRSTRFVQSGEWVDSLADWDLYATVTFEPSPRRAPNSRGFARVETRLRRGAGHSARLAAGDLETGLSTTTPGMDGVQAFFSRWIYDVLTPVLLTRVDYYVGFEAGRLTGINHFHALLAGQGLRERFEQERNAWRQAQAAGIAAREFCRNRDYVLWPFLFREAGRSAVAPFVPALGAGWYLAATYIGKKQLGWDVSVGNRALVEHRPARGGGMDVARSAELPRSIMHNTLGRWHR
jgi:hypothetical protein